MRISGVTIRLALLPYTAVFKNHKQGQDAVRSVTGLNHEASKVPQSIQVRENKKGGLLALIPFSHTSLALVALWTG